MRGRRDEFGLCSAMLDAFEDALEFLDADIRCDLGCHRPAPSHVVEVHPAPERLVSRKNFRTFGATARIATAALPPRRFAGNNTRSFLRRLGLRHLGIRALPLLQRNDVVSLVAERLVIRIVRGQRQQCRLKRITSQSGNLLRQTFLSHQRGRQRR